MKTLTIYLNEKLLTITNKSLLKRVVNLHKSEKKDFTYEEYSECLIEEFNNWKSSDMIVHSILGYVMMDNDFKFKDHVTIIFEVTPFAVCCDWFIHTKPMTTEEIHDEYQKFLNNRPDLLFYKMYKQSKKSLVESEI